MSGQKRPGTYSAEVRERAVRMVLDHRDDYPSEWAAITSIAKKIGVSHETLRIWFRRTEGTPGSGPALPPTSELE